MSTQTSALPDGTTLTKPAASERVSLSVINTNTDNIANNIIGLNSRIETYSFGKKASLSDFVTPLNAYISALDANSVRNITIEFTAASAPFRNAKYIGILTKTTDIRAQLTLHLHNGQHIVHGIQNETTWSWDEYALNSQLMYQAHSNIATQSAFDTVLDNALSSAPTNSEIHLRINPSASFGLFISSEIYMVDMKKTASTTYSTAIISQVGAKKIINATRGTNGWSYDSFATKGDVDAVGVKMSENIRVSTNGGNASSFSFTAPRGSDAYKYFLLVGGHSSSVPFIYHGHVNTSSNNYAVTLTLMGGVAVSGLQATYNGTTITFTTTGTQWGGLRLLWLC